MDFSYHQLSETTALNLIQLLRSLKLLHELLIDGTLLPSRSAFFGFYGQLWSVKTLRSVSFPLIDFSRILGNHIFTSDWKTERFTKFQERICSKLIPSSSFIRSEYYLKSLDMSNFSDFCLTFPISAISIPNTPIGVRFFQENSKYLKSFIDNNFLSIKISFNEYQLKNILSPLKPPKYLISTDIIVPNNLKRFFGEDYIRINNDNFKNILNNNDDSIRTDFIEKYSNFLILENYEYFEILEKISLKFQNYKINHNEIQSNYKICDPFQIFNDLELFYFKKELNFLRQKSINENNNKINFSGSNLTSFEFTRTDNFLDNDQSIEEFKFSKKTPLNLETKSALKLVSFKKNLNKDLVDNNQFNDEEIEETKKLINLELLNQISIDLNRLKEFAKKIFLENSNLKLNNKNIFRNLNLIELSLSFNDFEINQEILKISEIINFKENNVNLNPIVSEDILNICSSFDIPMPIINF